MRRLLAICTASIVIICGSCKKTTEDPALLSVDDYFPLKVGKYITYSLDSVVFYTNFNTTVTVNSYQIKQVVDAQVTDALGRPAYRILRYIRSNAAAPWVPDNTFMAVSTGNTVEFIENNLRFVKLASPLRQDFSWQGNRYIDVSSSGSTVKYYANWDYTYDSINAKATIGAISVDSTIKVAHIDNQTSIDRTFSEEKYARGIGLVYRNFLFWDKGSGVYSNNSYGVIMKMIDHN